MSTKRELIVEQVKSRFSGIRTTNGYRTNVGQNVFNWKTQPWDETELPGCNIRDLREDQELQVNTKHHRTLQLSVDIAVAGTNAATDIRNAIGDVEQCIGLDRRFGTLVFNTNLRSDQMDVLQDDFILGVAEVTFDIQYRTDQFNPDS